MTTTIPSQLDFHLREVAYCSVEHMWNKQLWLFGNTAEYTSVAIRILGFVPHCVIDYPTSAGGHIAWLQKLNTFLTELHLPKATAEIDHMTPVVGFCNAMPRKVLRVYYRTDQVLRKLRGFVSRYNHRGEKLCIYHDDWSVKSLFLFQCKLKMNSWLRVTGLRRPIACSPDGYPCRRHTYAKIEAYVGVDDVSTSPDQPICVPPIVCCALRLRPEADGQRLNTMAAVYYRMCGDILHRAIYRRVRKEDGERVTELQMLYAFYRDVISFDVDCYVVLNDLRNTLVSVYERTMTLQRVTNRSLGRFDMNRVRVTQRLVPKRCRASLPGMVVFMNVQETARAVHHPGRSRMDVKCALQKMMVTPKLDAFTLASAVAHPSICRQRATNDDDSDALLVETHYLNAIDGDNCLLLGYLELSAACYESLTNMVERGQQLRVWSKFTSKFAERKLLANKHMLTRSPVLVRRSRAESTYPDPPPVENRPIYPVSQHVSLLQKTVAPKKKGKRYTGGHVCDPEVGFYTGARQAVITFDFASLYPSIIRAYKICYMRLVYDRSLLDDPRATLEYVSVSDTECIVMVSHYDGQPVTTFLPETANEVCDERSRVRRQMKKVPKGSFEYSSMDAKQLACKVFQNALYGFLGVERHGMFACPVLMAAVCCIGRFMIKTVRHVMITEYRGYVVYGDTDSVMVQFPTSEALPDTSDDDAIVSYLYKLAARIETRCDSLFPPPNALEFETLKSPFILYRKKNYAALEYGCHPGAWSGRPKLTIKGLSFKKRDRCLWVRRMGARILDLLLADDHDKIVPFVRAQCSLLFECKVPLDDLAISCLMQNEYKNTQIIQAVTAAKETKRTGIPVEAGSRLVYVVVRNDTARFCECGETLSYAKEHAMKPDIKYYIEKQMGKAIMDLVVFLPRIYHELERVMTDFQGRIDRKRNSMRPITEWFRVTQPRKRTRVSVVDS